MSFAEAAKSAYVGLAGLLSTDQEILRDSCWSLSYLAEDDSEEFPILELITREHEYIGKIITLMKPETKELFIPALRLMGNILTITSISVIDTAIKHGLLDRYAELIQL